MVKARAARKKVASEKLVKNRSATRPLRIRTPDGEVLVWRALGRVYAASRAGQALSKASHDLVLQAVQARYGSGKTVRFTTSPRTGSPAGRTLVPEGTDRDIELDELRRSLVARFSPSPDDLDPVPRHTVEQARRFAALASELMRQGAYDHRALAAGWGIKVEAARKRVQRAEDRHELFTVSYKDRTFVPAFLLDEHLDTRPELGPIIATLTAAGEHGFALWAWLTTPSAWLDGEVPHELARTELERVLRSAEQRASNVA